MDIAALFPSPVATFFDFITEEERLQIFESVMSVEHPPHGAITGKGFSTHTKAVQEDVRSSTIVSSKIIDRMQDAVDQYGSEYGSKSTELMNIWSNIQHAGSRLREHTHPNSVISGALYINVDESCKLYFHNPNPYMKFFDRGTDTFFNYEYYWLQVKNCELVLFPSWLMHGRYEHVNTMDNRIVVSLNSGFPRRENSGNVKNTFLWK